MCISMMKFFHNNKDRIDNTEIDIGCPLRIKRLCNEEQSDHPVTDKRFLKQLFK